MGLVTLGYVKECLKFYLDFLCKLCGQCFDIRYCHNDTFCFIRDVKGRHRNRDDVCPVIVNIFDQWEKANRQENLSYIGTEFSLACVAGVSMSAASAKQNVQVATSKQPLGSVLQFFSYQKLGKMLFCQCNRNLQRSQPLDKTRMCSYKRNPHLQGDCFLNGFLIVCSTVFINLNNIERKEVKEEKNKQQQELIVMHNFGKFCVSKMANGRQWISFGPLHQLWTVVITCLFCKFFKCSKCIFRECQSTATSFAQEVNCLFFWSTLTPELKEGCTVVWIPLTHALAVWLVFCCRRGIVGCQWLGHWVLRVCPSLTT